MLGQHPASPRLAPQGSGGEGGALLQGPGLADGFPAEGEGCGAMGKGCGGMGWGTGAQGRRMEKGYRGTGKEYGDTS